MRTIIRSSGAAVVLLVLLMAGNALADLTVGNYALVSSKRVSRTECEYTYQGQVTNDDQAVKNVAAQVTSNSSHTTIIEGVLEFGDVAAGSSLQSTDTFTIKQDRLYPFDPSSLQWNIRFTPAFITVTGKAVAGVPVVGTE